MYGWNITEYTIYKPKIETNKDNYDEKDPNNYHYVYVCRKGVDIFNLSIIYFYRLLILTLQSKE